MQSDLKGPNYLYIYALLTDMKNKITSLPLVDTWMAEGRIKLLSHISRAAMLSNPLK
jgi:hypothetical protein